MIVRSDDQGFRRCTAALILVALVASGCGGAYRYRFVTGLPEGEREVKEWRHLAGYGWREVEPFDLEAACPDGVARFGSYVSFLNWLPTFFTLGIYSPRTVYAVCAKTEAPS